MFGLTGAKKKKTPITVNTYTVAFGYPKGKDHSMPKALVSASVFFQLLYSAHKCAFSFTFIEVS